MRAPESVKKGAWYLGGRKKKPVARKKNEERGEKDNEVKDFH